MSIVKSNLLKQLANNFPNFLNKDLKKSLNLVIDEIINGLSENKNVEIRGFGSMKTKIQKTRNGRNPKSGTKIKIPSRKTIKWKMSKDLFNTLNKDLNDGK